MTKKNDAEIQRVKRALVEGGPQSTRGLMAICGLTKGKLHGAIAALTADGTITSEGATLKRVHRIAGDDREPASAAPTSRTRRVATTKQAARTRTPPPPQKAEASPAPAPRALEIAMDDAGCVRLVRNGAAPFALLTPDEHRRVYDFLDRMEPVWSAP